MSEIIHVDTGSVNKLITKVDGNPFDCTYRLVNKYKNIRYVKLLNAQIPYGFYNIREPYNSIKIQDTSYTIPIGNYFSTSSFIGIVNTTVTAVAGAFSVPSTSINKVTYANTTAQTIYTSTPYPNTQVSSGYFSGVQPTIIQGGYTSSYYPSLSTIMGFENNPSGTSLTAKNSFLYNFDTYIKIHITNLATSSKEADPCSFKVPVSVPFGSIIELNENSNNKQIVYLPDSTIVDRLDIKVYDRYNNLLNNNGLDWSFSLEIGTA
jgi:hypothetical protein